MPFNYDAQLNYMPISQATIQGASKSPFEIAGRAMNELNDSIDDRAFTKSLGSVSDLEGLAGLTARTPKQQAMMNQKQGIFTADALQQMKKDALTETIRHNKVIEQPKPLAKKGWGVTTDPLSGQSRLYNKDEGVYGATLGGNSGIKDDKGRSFSISNKTGVIALPDGTSVYADRFGDPYLVDGKTVVKARSKFNLEMPSNISQEQATADSIEKIVKNVKTNPKAVGSLGSGAWNFVANNINDMLKVPTDDRLARNQISAASGVLAANIRSMFEKGVMTEPDFERYKKLVPTENDSVEEFTLKATTLQNELIKSMRSKAEMQGTKAPEVRGISTSKATDKYNVGQRVRQGGKTYQFDGTNWKEI